MIIPRSTQGMHNHPAGLVAAMREIEAHARTVEDKMKRPSLWQRLFGRNGWSRRVDNVQAHATEYLSREPGTPTMAEVQAENVALRSALKLMDNRYNALLAAFTDYSVKHPMAEGEQADAPAQMPYHPDNSAWPPPEAEDHPVPFNPPPVGNRPF